MFEDEIEPHKIRKIILNVSIEHVAKESYVIIVQQIWFIMKVDFYVNLICAMYIQI